MNSCCPFGLSLRTERIKKGIPLWRYAASIPYPQNNVQRIERGLTEPRIDLSVRLISALGTDMGPFMAALAFELGWSIPKETFESAKHIQWDMIQCDHYFGSLLRSVRTTYGISQNTLASYARYTARNLISVENGNQSPRVMTALRLVCSLECDVSGFFRKLQEWSALNIDAGMTSSG